MKNVPSNNQVIHPDSVPILKKYHLLFELAADAIIIGDSQGNFTDANQSATRLTGYSKAELLEKNMASLFLAEELDRNPLDYNLLKEGKIVTNDRILARKDGTTIHIEMSSRMMPDGSYHAFLRDISHRKGLEQNLEELLHHQEVMTEAALEALFLSVKGICVAQNKRAEEMFGYTNEEASGKPGTDWIIPEERDKVLHRMLSGFQGIYETVGLTKSGDRFPVEIQGRMTTFQGKETRVTALRDISLKKKAEQDLLTIQKLESIGTLAGGLAHDLNNILTGLFGNLSLAKLHLKSTDPAHEFLDKAESSLNRVTRITNKLLTFAKGGQPIVETVGLDELVTDIVQFDLTGSNVMPVFHIDENLWYAIVDKGQIQQVFSNLTINANQAMPEGGKLFISLSNYDNSEGFHAHLTPGLFIKAQVRDEGQGIPPEKLTNIFDPYFSTKQKGRGLGLTSVHSIMSRHQGVISVESTLELGTTFTLYLPASLTPKSEDERQASPFDSEPFKGYKVLMVDDDPEVCTVATDLLHSLGCSVTVTHNEKQAIAAFTEANRTNHPFGMAILDLTIPGEPGGAQTVKKLLQIDPNTKMIVSSGYNDAPIMANFAEHGFSGFLSKPYTRENLYEVLKQNALPAR